jgi:uncharacterized Tic20 family protein
MIIQLIKRKFNLKPVFGILLILVLIEIVLYLISLPFLSISLLDINIFGLFVIAIFFSLFAFLIVYHFFYTTICFCFNSYDNETYENFCRRYGLTL